jgi:hypothetical protein
MPDFLMEPASLADIGPTLQTQAYPVSPERQIHSLQSQAEMPMFRLDLPSSETPLSASLFSYFKWPLSPTFNPMLQDTELPMDPNLAARDAASQEYPCAFPVADEDIFILRYYFDTICVMNSVFDSPENPLRYVVARSFNSSSLIYNCALSVSATHLARGKNHSRVRELAIKCHSNVADSLRKLVSRLEIEGLTPYSTPTNADKGDVSSIVEVEQALFACLLLGVTAVRPPLPLCLYLAS